MEKIRRWLNASDAEVSWNEHAPDAEHPERPGQTDIAIKRGGRTTLVALRAQSAPQTVEWIDELDAERRRLDADAVIAVSSSGLTSGALLKARQLGVMTRDLATLSAGEIKTWGAMVPLTLVFFEFRNMEVTISLPGPVETNELVITNDREEPIVERDVLIGIVQNHFDDLQYSFVRLRGNLQGAVLVNGVAAQGISFEGRVRGRAQESEVPALSIFGGSDGMGESAGAVKSVILDLSKIAIPERCVFGYPLFPEAERGGARAVDVIGTENAMRSKVHLRYGLKWTGAAAGQ